MKISNWDTHYENAQSRKVHHLSWVPVPNKHDGERYSELMAREDSAEIFAAWILILQIASRSQHRGSILRDNGKCHTPESLAIKTRGNAKWFKKAIPYLLQIGWLQGVMEDAPSVLPERSQSGGVEQKGTEQKEKKEEVASLPSPSLTINQLAAKGVLDYLNEKTGSTLPYDVALLKPISFQLGKNYSVSDCKLVIDSKVKDWGKDPTFSKMLVPSTLFKEGKFAEYLSSAKLSNRGQTAKLRPTLEEYKAAEAKL